MKKTVEVGQYVRVPKGTPVFHGNASWDEPIFNISKRDATVGIIEVNHGASALDTLRRLYQSARHGNNPHHVTDEQNLMKAEMVRLGNDGTLICWGDSKYTVFEGLEVVEPPKRVAKGPTKIQQMVPGSRWKITQDVELSISGIRRSGGRAIDNVKDQPYLRATAGTVFEITGKKHSTVYVGFPRGANPFGKEGFESAGTFLQAKVVQGSIAAVSPEMAHPQSFHKHTADTTHLLPYIPLEPVIEAESIPQVKVYLLRDRATGEYFKEAWPLRFSDKPRLDMTAYAKAKKWDDLGALKGAINNFTGYFAGMPYGYGAGRPDWMGDGEKIADLPKTFEAVVFDKLAKTEIETIDIQAWHERTWALRSLTIQFGSVVRKLYNDLDQKGVLDEFRFVAVVAVPVENERYYGDELTEAEKTEFAGIAARAGLKRGDSRRSTDAHSMAYAVRDASTAFYLKMLHQGRFPMKVLDMRDLKEVVQEEDARRLAEA